MRAVPIAVSAGVVITGSVLRSNLFVRLIATPSDPGDKRRS